ncbi:MAG: hypothetical protein V2A62_01205 [Candidatus Woesearchaeota archaeon]
MIDFKIYLHSFKPRKEWLYTFLVDLVSISIIIAILLSFGGMLNTKALALTGGQDVETFKATLLSGTSEIGQEFLSSVKVFAATFFIGGALVVFILLLLHSFSTKLVWELLTKKKLSWKPFWRWNALTLLFAFLSFMWVLLFAGIMVVLTTLLSLQGTLSFWFLRTLALFFLLLFMLLIFLTNYSFVHKYRVMEALGEAFHQMKKFFWWPFILMLGTSVVISIFIYLIGTFFLNTSETAYNIFSAIVFFLFLAWMRIYVVNIVKGEQHG